MSDPDDLLEQLQRQGIATLRAQSLGKAPRAAKAPAKAKRKFAAKRKPARKGKAP